MRKSVVIFTGKRKLWIASQNIALSLDFIKNKLFKLQAEICKIIVKNTQEIKYSHLYLNQTKPKF